MAAKIVVSASEGDESPLSEHLLSAEIVHIGRSMDNTVVLPDVEKRVSSKHARIEKRGSLYQLTDLGSKNGTLVNERKIEPNRPVPLRNGDRLAIGVYRLRFLTEDLDTVGTTIRVVDLSRQSARVADEVAVLYARHASSPPETRAAAILRALQNAQAQVGPENARALLTQVRSRFQSGADSAGPPDASTMMRRRDDEIRRQEDLYRAGLGAVNSLSARLLGDAKFDTVEQVDRFAKLLDQTLDVTFRWLANCLKGRQEFEEQFSADLTMVFALKGNPIKTGGTAEEIGRYLLDWRSPRDAGTVRDSLEGAFKDLTMHQLGLLAGVQDCIKEILRRMDPKVVEHELHAKAGGGLSGLMLKLSLARRAWRHYRQRYQELFDENSKLFNEMIYPNIRKGYLASHAEAAPGAPPPAP